MPAWRSVSPKKRRTRSEKTSATMREQNLTISPNDAIQSFGTESQPMLPAHYLITVISGWVASSVCVNT